MSFFVQIGQKNMLGKNNLIKSIVYSGRGLIKSKQCFSGYLI